MPRLRSSKRIVALDWKVQIPRDIGISPDDVVEFGLLDNGIVTITKLVRSAEVPPEVK